MGKSYTSTIEVRCFKEHTCVCCGGVFTYEFYRKIQGTGSKPETASANAEANVRKALEHDVDAHPCPTCGIYQPDMIGNKRRSRHLLMFWLALIAIAVVLITRAAYGFGAQTATWVALAVVGLAALVHLMSDLKNPNADLAANKALAASEVASGRVINARPGKVTPGADELACKPARSGAHLAALMMLPLAVALVLFPEGMRMSKGWPANAETYPPVAGPGDTVRVYMKDKITSIKSYWRGKQLLVGVAEHGGKGAPVPASATTNENNWGATISVKSSEKNSTSTPYVNVTLPDKADLGGKTVDCDIKLVVEYPEVSGTGFVNAGKLLQRQLPIELAKDAHAGETYNGWWWEGTAGGGGLVLLSGLLLAGAARGFSRRCNPTRVIPVAQPVGPPPVPGTV